MLTCPFHTTQPEIGPRAADTGTCPPREGGYGRRRIACRGQLTALRLLGELARGTGGGRGEDAFPPTASRAEMAAPSHHTALHLPGPISSLDRCLMRAFAIGTIADARQDLAKCCSNRTWPTVHSNRLVHLERP